MMIKKQDELHSVPPKLLSKHTLIKYVINI